MSNGSATQSAAMIVGDTHVKVSQTETRSTIFAIGFWGCIVGYLVTQTTEISAVVGADVVILNTVTRIRYEAAPPKPRRRDEDLYYSAQDFTDFTILVPHIPDWLLRCFEPSAPISEYPEYPVDRISRYAEHDLLAGMMEERRALSDISYCPPTTPALPAPKALAALPAPRRHRNDRYISPDVYDQLVEERRGPVPPKIDHGRTWG